MAQRHLLSEISSNRPAGYKLTVNNKAQIVGTIKYNIRSYEVSWTLNFIFKTIFTTV
jgi:hypothetical protein